MNVSRRRRGGFFLSLRYSSKETWISRDFPSLPCFEMEKEAVSPRKQLPFFSCLRILSMIERGIEGIEILFIQIIPDDLKAFTETLIMDDLPFSQKADNIFDIGVINEA